MTNAGHTGTPIADESEGGKENVDVVRRGILAGLGVLAIEATTGAVHGLLNTIITPAEAQVIGEAKASTIPALEVPSGAEEIAPFLTFTNPIGSNKLVMDRYTKLSPAYKKAIMIIAQELYPKMQAKGEAMETIERNIIGGMIMFFISYKGEGDETRKFDAIFSLLGNKHSDYSKSRIFSDEFFALAGVEKGTPGGYLLVYSNLKGLNELANRAKLAQKG